MTWWGNLLQTLLIRFASPQLCLFLAGVCLIIAANKDRNQINKTINGNLVPPTGVPSTLESYRLFYLCGKRFKVENDKLLWVNHYALFIETKGKRQRVKERKRWGIGGWVIGCIGTALMDRMQQARRQRMMHCVRQTENKPNALSNCHKWGKEKSLFLHSEREREAEQKAKNEFVKIAGIIKTELHDEQRRQCLLKRSAGKWRSEQI